MRVKWKKLDPNKIEEYCTNYYNRWKERPSVRDIFYAFVGEWWANTISHYQGLSNFLVNERIIGRIDWKLIRDGSGRKIESGDFEEIDPEIFFRYHLERFKNCSNNYFLPKWKDQPKKIVILCEKEADFPVVESIVSDLNVDVGYMRGYSGWRIFFEMKEDFEKFGKVPIIIVLGDFDPSGEDIVDFIRRAFPRLKTKINVIKIAVTKEQIEKFDLPHRPEDEKEIAKLQKDPRFKKWKWGLYRVETASLRVRQPDYFEKIVRETILKYFNKKIYKKVEIEQEKKRKIVKDLLEKY